MVKVSIVVAAYNVGKYLDRCLDSLVRQTLDDIEIIVVNDASSDNTLSIIEEYRRKNPNIILVNHEKNMGIGRTRNDGIKMASGEYIGFVDGDDYVEADMFEKYYEHARKHDLDIVYGGYYEDRGDTMTPMVIRSFENGTIEDNPEILTKMECGPVDKIYRSEIIKKNNILFPEGIKYEDLPFVMIVADYGRIGCISEDYYHYVIHSNSESTTIDRRCFDLFKALDMVNDHYAGRHEREIEYFNVLHVTRHLLRQKYQKDKNAGRDFIEQGYDYLDGRFPNWRKNPYYVRQSFARRMIKNSRLLTKLYCGL